MEYYSMMAYILISSAAGSQPPEIDECEFECFRLAAQKLAIDWEIMDPREENYIFANFIEFDADLTIIRRRYEELKFAPKLQQIDSLPDRSVVNELLSFNREFTKQLECRLQLYPFQQYMIQEAIDQNNRLYLFWDNIRDAKSDFYYVAFRRKSAMNAINIIGPQAYYSRDFPPVVPTWLFREIK